MYQKLNYKDRIFVFDLGIFSIYQLLPNNSSNNNHNDDKRQFHNKNVIKESLNIRLKCFLFL